MVDEGPASQEASDEAQQTHPEEHERIPWYFYAIVVGIVLYMCVAWMPLFGY